MVRLGGLGHNGVVKMAERADAAPVTPTATRDRLALLLLEHGPSTAASLAELVGLTAAAVRRHLDCLVADGLAAASERPPYGPVRRRGRGRPARVYSLTAVGRDRFPQAYDTLALDALHYIGEVLGEDGLQAFARSRVEELVDRHRDAVLRAPAHRRLRVLTGALTAEGFAASVETAPSGQGDQLCQHHCPVAHVAAQFPQLCEAETAAFAELLGTHVQRLATIGHGDHVCTTYVPHLTEGARP